MAVFRVEKNSGYTVMSNNHLRNRNLSLKAKGLLSQMLSLPEDWDYTLQGLARINRESIDAIRQAIRELEQAGYIQRSRERDEKGRLRGADYVIFELPQPIPASVSPTLENPTLENPTQENPTLENPMQLNADCQKPLVNPFFGVAFLQIGIKRTVNGLLWVDCFLDAFFAYHCQPCLERFSFRRWD